MVRKSVGGMFFLADDFVDDSNSKKSLQKVKHCTYVAINVVHMAKVPSYTYLGVLNGRKKINQLHSIISNSKFECL